MATEEIASEDLNGSKARSYPIALIMMLCGGVFVILGSFMGWATVFGLSVAGIEGDGKITLTLGIGILLLSFFSHRVGSSRNRVLLLAATYIFSLVALLTVVYDGAGISKINSSGPFSLGVSIGSGIYVCFIGGILSIAGVIYNISETNKKRLVAALSGKQKASMVIMVAMVLIGTAGAYVAAGENSPGPGTDSGTSGSSGPFASSKDAEPEIPVELAVVSSNFKEGAYGSSHVRGEIKNTGSDIAYDPKITVTLLSKGEVVASSSYADAPSMITSNLTVPFEAMIDNPPAYDEIKVDVEGKSKSYQDYSYLKIINQTERKSEYGQMYVAGEVENTSAGNLSSVKVFAYLLAASGNVVELEADYLDGAIEPGARKPYEVSFFGSDDLAYQTIRVIALGS